MNNDRPGVCGPPSLSPSGVGAMLRWIRANMFSSPLNVVLTCGAAYLLYRALPPLVNWLIVDATWTGQGREACGPETGGACWVFVRQRIGQFIYGFYPPSARWRVNLVGGLVAGVFALFSSGALRKRSALSGAIILGTPILLAILLRGGFFGLSSVETSQWGGLMLTLTISVVGIVVSLPFGIALALGRRSRLPIVRWLSVAFIEFWRGVPLITVLFMASVMLPLFMPEGVSFDKLLRAMLGIVLFESAYMAEVVRGGLQAIPRGQFEAAESLGLGYGKTVALIVLPQALKMVIPGIVNTFIALFKDTALVLIIGLFDLLGAVQAAFRDPQWLGFATEGYVFAAFVFWIFCFSMSRYSQRLERRLSPGK